MFSYKKNLLVILLILFFGKPIFALDQKGMALGLFSKDMNYSYLNDLKEMRALGITHILLVVSWYQNNIESNEIIPREYDGNDILTLPDPKLKEVISQAHSLGLKTVLFPILRIENRKEKDWRGVIKPKDIRLWWSNYDRFIQHYIDIAVSEKVEFFSIGSELLSREPELDQWKKIIGETRKKYSGKLLYSANWDHYQNIPFWNLLDFIGLTAYHELSKTREPTLKNLKHRWGHIRAELLHWKRKYPKQKLVFTEIGYPSIDGTSMYPWNYYLKGKVDLNEQALCYRAFIETWKKTRQLGGVYFWVWWGKGGKEDHSYTPRDKPASLYIKRWYKNSNHY